MRQLTAPDTVRLSARSPAMVVRRQHLSFPPLRDVGIPTPPSPLRLPPPAAAEERNLPEKLTRDFVLYCRAAASGASILP